MRVLIACEFSGIVRNAFIRAGHEAISCDLLPTKSPGPHIIGDCLESLRDGWDLLVAHPPCTYLCVAGRRWWKGKEKEQKRAIQFFTTLLTAPIKHICIENPVGIISTRIKRPTQYIQPYEFGDPYQKKIGLWLKNLPPLKPTQRAERVFLTYNNFPGVKDRAQLKSIFFPGIARAMAEQWSSL